MKTIFFLVLLVSGSSMAQTTNNPLGYFVILTNTTGPTNFPDRAIVGNRTNPRIAVISCQSGFQAEGVISVNCLSKDSTVPNMSAGTLSVGGGGQLVFYKNVSGPIFLTLDCMTKPNAFSPYVCK